jgi:hypothetical protein
MNNEERMPDECKKSKSVRSNFQGIIINKVEGGNSGKILVNRINDSTDNEP